jgi:hypothetical protein
VVFHPQEGFPQAADLLLEADNLFLISQSPTPTCWRAQLWHLAEGTESLQQMPMSNANLTLDNTGSGHVASSSVIDCS